MYAPVTTGSEHDPLPIGTAKINGVSWNPPFHYNPKLFWDAEASDEKATIHPGPNNPVGVVWVDLSIKHYGIHGTPEPRLIGQTESHGCIRLTNWDAAALGKAVKKGTPVEFSAKKSRNRLEHNTLARDRVRTPVRGATVQICRTVS
jgi:lipoprotein-anchoring transpeptidase ErfK/SrfK